MATVRKQRKSPPKQKLFAAKTRKAAVKKKLGRKAARKAISMAAAKTVGGSAGVAFVALKVGFKAAKKTARIGSKAVGKVDKLMSKFSLWR